MYASFRWCLRAALTGLMHLGACASACTLQLVHRGGGPSGVPPAVLPQGHPDRLVPDQPMTDDERRLWSQLL